MTDPSTREASIADSETTPQLAPLWGDGDASDSTPRTDRVSGRQARAQEAIQRRSALGRTAVLRSRAGHSEPSHPTEDELFVILEGHAAVLAGDRELDAPAGSLVIVPAMFPMTCETWATGVWSSCSSSFPVPSARSRSPKRQDLQVHEREERVRTYCAAAALSTTVSIVTCSGFTYRLTKNRMPSRVTS
jgi:mannose-6-phosphate isomerase-like protein (cupin superfamily)